MDVGTTLFEEIVFRESVSLFDVFSAKTKEKIPH